MFAISLCFSLIIIYDATNLRRSAGFHAEWLNEIVPQLLHGKFIRSETSFRKLRELLGHNPIEVFVGGILGVLVAVWFVKVFILLGRKQVGAWGAGGQGADYAGGCPGE